MREPRNRVVQVWRFGGPDVLEVVDVAFRHAGRATDVLSGCDLVIRPGDRVLIQGPSGNGKSCSY